MALTVGTDTYVTASELTSYVTARGYVIKTGDEEVLLVRAMDYIESLTFKGTRTSTAQALTWPRTGVYVDNVLLDSATVPERVKKAQMAAAVAVGDGADPLAKLEPAVKREKADVVEVEYQDGAAPAAISRAVRAVLRPLLAAGTGGGASFAVGRA